MESLKELVLRKIVHMHTVSSKPYPKFRIDSIALILHLPENEVKAGIEELLNDHIITYHPPERHLSNHATSNFGEVALNIPVDEARQRLHQMLKLA